MSLAKDQSLTVVIHGKDQNVMKARREIVSRLQTQVRSCTMKLDDISIKKNYILLEKLIYLLRRSS